MEEFCCSHNARLRGIGRLREGGTGVRPLQAATEKCGANWWGGSSLSELFQRNSMVGSLLSAVHACAYKSASDVGEGWSSIYGVCLYYIKILLAKFCNYNLILIHEIDISTVNCVLQATTASLLQPKVHFQTFLTSCVVRRFDSSDCNHVSMLPVVVSGSE